MLKMQHAQARHTNSKRARRFFRPLDATCRDCRQGRREFCLSAARRMLPRPRHAFTGLPNFQKMTLDDYAVSMKNKKLRLGTHFTFRFY